MPAYALKLPCFKHPQELGLKGEIQFTNLIQECCAFSRRFKQPRLRSMRPRESSFLVTE